MKDSVSKKELSIATAIIALLIGAVSWFVVDTIKEAKEQNKAQWIEAGKTKECLFDKINRLDSRISHIEGLHDAERRK